MLKSKFKIIFFATLSLLNCMCHAEIDKIVVKANKELCKVSKKFLSIAIDTQFVFKYDLNKLIESEVFMKMARGLHPAYLRIGGTAADLVVFDTTTEDMKTASNFSNLAAMEELSWRTDESVCINQEWPVLHLSVPQWLSINTLARDAKLNLIFDLNVLTRTASGKWDPTNALKLIQFSHEHNLSLDWQLGNEPNSFCHVFGKEVPPKQLAADIHTLSLILKKFPLYRKSKLLGPEITSPRGPKKRHDATLNYLDNFMSSAKHNVTAATWHQYYLNGRNSTKADFMNHSVMERLRREIRDVKAVVTRKTDAHFPVWITETATAFGGGAPGLSNRFVGTFMWLDKLGMSAAHNISVVMRQSFIGNNYGLIDQKTMEPTAGFWISYLHKKLVGQTVLKLETTLSTPTVRLYAHCFKKSNVKPHSVVVFGMNLGSTDYKGEISTQNENRKIFKIKKYILTGEHNDLCSRNIQLNGKVLAMTGSGDLPALVPLQLKTNTIDLPPESIGFFVIHGLKARACR